MFEKYGMTELHFKLPMLANLFDDVVAVLDDATKQIREQINDLDAEIQKFGYEGVYPTNIPCEANLVGQKRALIKVLAILDGEKNE